MREYLIALSRKAASGVNKPSYYSDFATFEPHEWALDAMRLAYDFGHLTAKLAESTGSICWDHI